MGRIRKFLLNLLVEKPTTGSSGEYASSGSSSLGLIIREGLAHCGDGVGFGVSKKEVKKNITNDIREELCSLCEKNNWLYGILNDVYIFHPQSDERRWSPGYWIDKRQVFR